MCEWGTEGSVKVLIPADLSHTGEERWKWAGIDLCISHIVAALQSGGVNMRGSCCGHGERDGRIVLTDGRTLIVSRTTTDDLEV